MAIIYRNCSKQQLITPPSSPVRRCLNLCGPLRSPIECMLSDFLTSNCVLELEAWAYEAFGRKTIAAETHYFWQCVVAQQIAKKRKPKQTKLLSRQRWIIFGRSVSHENKCRTVALSHTTQKCLTCCWPINQSTEPLVRRTSLYYILGAVTTTLSNWVVSFIFPYRIHEWH